ncbi:DUF5065 family protein [Bacillus cereus]|uniref:DUF5065 family protein n=1 Tax=Bacillus cereus TaxID=1396 RepID=UPI00405514BA
MLVSFLFPFLLFSSLKLSHKVKKNYDSGTAHIYGSFVTPITSVYKLGLFVDVMKIDKHNYYGGSFKIKK